MKRLQKNFKRGGFQFEQRCRTEKVAIYLKHVDGRQQSYEVILIRIATRKPSKTADKTRWVDCESYECYPASERWGVNGWTYTTEANAKAKFDWLNLQEANAETRIPARKPIGVDGIAQERVLRLPSINTAEVAQLCRF